jgi:hypothetical protein
MANIGVSPSLTIPNSNNLMEINQKFHNRIWNTLSSIGDLGNQYGNTCSLKFLHHNAKSLFKNMFYYQSLSLEMSCDFFSVSETWLKPALPDCMVSLDGFTIVRDDRESKTKSRAGGAALYIKSGLKFKVLKTPQSYLKNLCALYGSKYGPIHIVNRLL